MQIWRAAKQNTTFWIKDVTVKYEELREVFQVVAARHGTEMVKEGKANIEMTVDLLIYFPIKIFALNIYTFTIPIQIETEIPINMLKQEEETKKQIEEMIKETIKGVQKIDETPQILPTETALPIPPSPSKTGSPLPTPTLPPVPTLPRTR